MFKLIEAAQSKVDGLLIARDKTVAALNEKMLLLAHAIRGNPRYGEDCPLYRALGFVPKSERKTGLTRSKSASNTATPDASGSADAA